MFYCPPPRSALWLVHVLVVCLYKRINWVIIFQTQILQKEFFWNKNTWYGQVSIISHFHEHVNVYMKYRDSTCTSICVYGRLFKNIFYILIRKLCHSVFILILWLKYIDYLRFWSSAWRTILTTLLNKQCRMKIMVPYNTRDTFYNYNLNCDYENAEDW